MCQLHHQIRLQLNYRWQQSFIYLCNGRIVQLPEKGRRTIPSNVSFFTTKKRSETSWTVVGPPTIAQSCLRRSKICLLSIRMAQCNRKRKFICYDQNWSKNCHRSLQESLPLFSKKKKILHYVVKWAFCGCVFSVLPVVTHSFESVPTTRVAIKVFECKSTSTQVSTWRTRP